MIYSDFDDLNPKGGFVVPSGTQANAIRAFTNYFVGAQPVWKEVTSGGTTPSLLIPYASNIPNPATSNVNDGYVTFYNSLDPLLAGTGKAIMFRIWCDGSGERPAISVIDPNSADAGDSGQWTSTLSSNDGYTEAVAVNEFGLFTRGEVGGFPNSSVALGGQEVGFVVAPHYTMIAPRWRYAIGVGSGNYLGPVLILHPSYPSVFSVTTAPRILMSNIGGFTSSAGAAVDTVYTPVCGSLAKTDNCGTLGTYEGIDPTFALSTGQYLLSRPVVRMDYSGSTGIVSNPISGMYLARRGMFPVNTQQIIGGKKHRTFYHAATGTGATARLAYLFQTEE